MNTLQKTLLASAFALGLSQAQAADYVIDTKGAHAAIEFKIQHLGISWLKGRFNRFSGNFSYDADNPNASVIRVKVATDSIDSNHAERDKHLKGKDFLDVKSFPEADFISSSYQSESADAGILKGDLTLHGVTRPVSIAVKKVGEGKDPWGGYRVGFEGTAAIKLKDFGIDYNLGPASETLYLDLFIEGIRQ